MRWIAAGAVLALLGTAERTAAQAEAAACTIDHAAMAAVQTLPQGEHAAYWDSVLRRDAVPRPGFAAGRPWVPIVFGNRRIIPYGLPRFIEGRELRRIGEHDGVGVYASQDEWWRVNVFYLPVREGCVFQPYQPAHWGPVCDEFGCPFPRDEPPPGATCQLRGDELVWAPEADERGEVSRAGLATSRRWYAADRPVAFRGHEYVKTGLPRQLPPGSVRRVGEIDGVGVYVGDEDGSARVYAFYVPVRAGCEFQLYEDASIFHDVRGD